MSLSIADHVAVVQKQIADACARSNRSPDDVCLVAVSKKKPNSDILEAIEAGLQHFGENRVEESQEKIPIVNDSVNQQVNWHMVGHIQSRKVKDVVSLFDTIHSLDSLKLAGKLSRTSVDMNKTLSVLVQVNISGEESKYGFQATNWKTNATIKEKLWHDMREMLALPSLNIVGLMTMAPYVDNIESTRPIFASLAALASEIRQSFSIELPELSMGMTNDYPVAIEEGATIVRVGRAIFGERA